MYEESADQTGSPQADTKPAFAPDALIVITGAVYLLRCEIRLASVHR